MSKVENTAPEFNCLNFQHLQLSFWELGILKSPDFPIYRGSSILKLWYVFCIFCFLHFVSFNLLFKAILSSFGRKEWIRPVKERLRYRYLSIFARTSPFYEWNNGVDGSSCSYISLLLVYQLTWSRLSRCWIFHHPIWQLCMQFLRCLCVCVWEIPCNLSWSCQ